MDLFLMRHAESHGNASGDYSTDHHDSLSPKGWSQAEIAAERLAGLPIDTIFCSALLRTQETIFPYLKKQNRRAQIWANISEACYQEDMDMGPCAGGPVDSFEPKSHVSSHLVFRDEVRDKCRPSEFESYGHGLHRVQETASALQQHYTHSGEKLLLVSHGFFLSMLIDVLLGIDPHRNHIHHDNTGLSHLSFVDQRWHLRFINRL